MRLLFVVNTLTVLLSFCYIYKDFVRQLKAFPPSFCHFCACEMSPGWGHLITWMDPSVGHLNGILARVGRNLNNNFQKSHMPGGGMLKLRFDRYISGDIFSSPFWITLGFIVDVRNAWTPLIFETVILYILEIGLSDWRHRCLGAFNQAPTSI